MTADVRTIFDNQPWCSISSACGPTEHAPRCFLGESTDAPPTNLVAALHHYLACCEQETRKARTARNREALSLYRAGVPVSQLAGILGISVRGAYKLLDSVE